MVKPIAILCLLCLLQAGAHEWIVEEYPNPNTKDGAEACNRNGTRGSICDPDGFIPRASADVVEGHIKRINDAAYPYGRSGCQEKYAFYSAGFQVAVALASSISKQGGESSADAAKRFANDLFDAWGVGNAECGNGLLLLIAFDDRQAYIAVGDLISQFASKTSLARVLEDMKPKLRTRDYGTAVEQAVIDLGLVLAGARPSPPDPPHESDNTDEVLQSFFWLVAGIVLFGLTCLACSYEKSQKSACTLLLEKLEREQETAKRTGQYPAASCPICFEDLKPLQAAQPSAPPMEPSPEGNDSSVCPPACSPTQPLLSGRVFRETADGNREVCVPREFDADGRKDPLCLRCGHTFCKSCIVSWLQRTANCPICRQYVLPGDTDLARQRQWVTQRERTNLNTYYYSEEMSFRMGGVQRRYPRYIPASAAAGGGHIDFTTIRQQMMEVENRSSFEESGHQGSDTNFGGGHHSTSDHGVGASW